MNLLLYRIGQLGDTIIALPAIWVIRQHFPGARLTMLCDHHLRHRFVTAAELLHGAGLIDEFLSYQVGTSPMEKLLAAARMPLLSWTLRRRHFDTLVYLAPSLRTPDQVARDRRFFQLAGIRHFLGMRGFNVPAPAPRSSRRQEALSLVTQPSSPDPQVSGFRFQVSAPPPQPSTLNPQPSKHATPSLPASPSEADLLLSRLALDGIPIPGPNQGSLNLCLGQKEEEEVDQWVRQSVSDGAKPWIGIGPGSKMPAKRWPLDRFASVVGRLIKDFDIWPVVFGGPEDSSCGNELIAAWGRGTNAAGVLGVRAAAAALKRCLLYLGNDTGTMHLAASVSTPVIAIFSSRAAPGTWYPYGVKQQVFRASIECEGCGLTTCVERKNECLNRIGVAEVTSACRDFLHHRRVIPSALLAG